MTQCFVNRQYSPLLWGHLFTLCFAKGQATTIEMVCHLPLASLSAPQIRKWTYSSWLSSVFQFAFAFCPSWLLKGHLSIYLLLCFILLAPHPRLAPDLNGWWSTNNIPLQANVASTLKGVVSLIRFKLITCRSRLLWCMRTILKKICGRCGSECTVVLQNVLHCIH